MQPVGKGSPAFVAAVVGSLPGVDGGVATAAAVVAVVPAGVGGALAFAAVASFLDASVAAEDLPSPCPDVFAAAAVVAEGMVEGVSGGNHRVFVAADGTVEVAEGPVVVRQEVSWTEGEEEAGSER